MRIVARQHDDGVVAPGGWRRSARSAAGSSGATTSRSAYEPAPTAPIAVRSAVTDDRRGAVVSTAVAATELAARRVGVRGSPRASAGSRSSRSLWVPLRPALTIAISGDDFINPFFVFDDYGPSPFGVFRAVNRDVVPRTATSTSSARTSARSCSSSGRTSIGWGVRYSPDLRDDEVRGVRPRRVLAAGRLLRTLAALGRSRVVGVVEPDRASRALFAGTIQIHVAWSQRPGRELPALRLPLRRDRARGRSISACARCGARIAARSRGASAVARRRRSSTTRSTWW